MKLFKDWEYWSTKYFYIPNVPYGLYLALRAKSLVFFSIANPCIRFSGNGTESKFKTLELIPKAHIPISIFIPTHEKIATVLEKIVEKNLNYPLIIKPDMGSRGLLVTQIKNESSLIDYLNKNNSIDLILQEFLDYKNECAIFYHRLPNNKKGNITSLTLKKFLTVIGDGKSSLKSLVINNERAKHYLKLISLNHPEKLDSIPEKDIEVVLGVIGNHTKGTQFFDGNHLITEELEQAMDRFFNKISDFHYGRLDLKYNSLDEIIHQNEFKVIELNGIISEPIHVYDGISGSYPRALKSFREHWKILYDIGIQQKKNGVKYPSVGSFIKSIQEFRSYLKKIENLSK